MNILKYEILKRYGAVCEGYSLTMKLYEGDSSGQERKKIFFPQVESRNFYLSCGLTFNQVC